MRNHLFISYATEDGPFVEWLGLRLTAEGYKVWCDRLKLLGGESYPKDIDKAIKWGTFRFLAILSHASLNKPNPTKERTLALNLARERNEDFVIPLNLGVSTTDLGWMLSDLTFIPFHLSWAEGLTQLLKKLASLDAPKPLQDGRSTAVTWFDSGALVKPRHERLWLNCAEFREIPKVIRRYDSSDSIPQSERRDILKLWPHTSSDNMFWAFEPPPPEVGQKYKFTAGASRRDWQATDDAATRQIGVRLLNDSLRSISLSRGLLPTADGNLYHFPSGLLPKDRLNFQSYDNKPTWTRCVGVRTFYTSTGKEESRYHLAPRLSTSLNHEIGQLVLIRLRLHITSLDGTPLDAKASLRRRKAICRGWWNHHWLARTLAVLQFLAGSNSTIEIGDKERIVVSKFPLTAHIASALDETMLKRESSEVTDEAEPVIDLNNEPKTDDSDGIDGGEEE